MEKNRNPIKKQVGLLQNMFLIIRWSTLPLEIVNDDYDDIVDKRKREGSMNKNQTQNQKTNKLSRNGFALWSAMNVAAVVFKF